MKSKVYFHFEVGKVDFSLTLNICLTAIGKSGLYEY